MRAPSSPPPDELDRLFRRLIHNLASLDPSRVHGPVDVAEVYEQLVPYRTHRTLLGLDSHADYEMAVLRLLAGERGYAFVEPEEARTALANEAAGVNPDTGAFKRFGGAQVTFDPDQVSAALGAEDVGGTTAPPPESAAAPLEARPWFPEAPEAGAGSAAPAGGTGASEPGEPGLPFALDDAAADRAGPAARPASAPCAYCGGELPVGRAVIFCPHCGQNVGVVHCPSCGTELDVGWGFCITCGRQMTGLG